MALILIPPPPPVESTYERSLLDFMGPHPPPARLYHMPVGTIGLNELAAGAKLADAIPAGCRIVSSWPDGTCTSCEMTNPTLYGNANFRNFTTGGLAGVAFARIVEAQALDAVQGEDYELRFLSVPGIYLEGLHLVSKGKSGDVVLPILSIDPQLGVEAVCDEETLLAVARPSAADRLRMASSDPLSS